MEEEGGRRKDGGEGGGRREEEGGRREEGTNSRTVVCQDGYAANTGGFPTQVVLSDTDTFSGCIGRGRRREREEGGGGRKEREEEKGSKEGLTHPKILTSVKWETYQVEWPV
jgi:hypothetical protein